MAKFNIFGIAGICVSGFVLLCAILACSLVLWEKGEISGFKFSIGLWKYCTETSCFDIDTSSSSYTDKQVDSFKAVRAMVIMSILLVAGTIASGILVLFVLTSMKVLYFVAAGLSFVAGFFLMVGMAVYADKLQNELLDYNAAFAFDIIAWIGAWVGGGLFVVAKMSVKE